MDVFLPYSQTASEKPQARVLGRPPSLLPIPGASLPSSPSQGLPPPSPLAVPPSLFIPLPLRLCLTRVPCDSLSTSSIFPLLLYFCSCSPRRQSVHSIPELKSSRGHFATQLLRSSPLHSSKGYVHPFGPNPSLTNACHPPARL
eukprot:TRINITY_DN17495_c0_g1_i1.p1 TRINITY_DN17495_c0_g1~~TRINITY_DN17495_c0_g1_i1.p1  ORF type:complete len:144 (-),score=0.98 TRINITY_DN17495_c0_g1_i1:28-459(-)